MKENSYFKVFALTGIVEWRVGKDIAAMYVIDAEEEVREKNSGVFFTNYQVRKVSFHHNLGKNEGGN